MFTYFHVHEKHKKQMNNELKLDQLSGLGLPCLKDHLGERHVDDNL